MRPLSVETALVLAAVELEKAEEALRRARRLWKFQRELVNGLLKWRAERTAAGLGGDEELDQAELAVALADEAAREREQRDAITALSKAHADMVAARARMLVESGVGAEPDATAALAEAPAA